MNAPLRWGKKDAAVCLLLAAAAAFLFMRAGENMSYDWNWDAALGYVAAPTEDGWAPGLLLSGAAASLRLLLFSGILALLVGGLAAALLMSPLRAPAVCYVEAMRNMPPLVFMFIFFYFAGGGWFEPLGAWLVQNGGVWGEFFLGDPRRAANFMGGVVCLAVFEGAFFAEIIRAGILSVERGQWESARALGLTRGQILRLVVLPQALKNAAAPLAGQFVFLVKDSAILSVISVPELAFSAQEASSSSRQIFEVWLLAAAFYFALCWPLLLLAEKLGRRR